MLYKVFATESSTGNVVQLVRNLISADSPGEAVNHAITKKIQLKTDNIRKKYVDVYDLETEYEEHLLIKKKVQLPKYQILVSENELSFVSDECPKANVSYTNIYAEALG